MIVSGTKVAYSDPQMKIWCDKEGRKQSGRRYELRKMQEAKYRDSLMPLNNIAGFRASGMSNYPSTLFRFPLRTKSSPGLISKIPSDVSKVTLLMEAFKEEAEVLLLFLRSVETIAVYTIDRAGNKSLQFSAEIRGASCSSNSLSEMRHSFKASLKDSFKNNKKCYGLGVSAPKTFTAKCTVKVTDASGLRRESTWLVSNQVGSNGHRKIIEAANELCAFPWVGTALNLSSQIKEGRIFCVIPLPAEVTTQLPVHVNGTFSLNDDRRSLKWPGKESGDEIASNWNKLLVEEVIPPCYASLLQEALHHNIAAEDLYNAIPDIEKVSQSMWEGLLLPLCSEMFGKACLWSLDERWIKAEEATFVPEGEEGAKVGVTVQQVLRACGHYIAVLPPNMWQALNLVFTSHSLEKMTPELATRALRANRMSYEHNTYEEKLELLQYCLSVSDEAEVDEFEFLSDSYEEDDKYCLNGISLLPLANGDFTAFAASANSTNFIYVCSEKYPHKLLPNAESFLLDPLHDNPSLHKSLKDLASSKHTQLRMLNAEGVAKLLPHVSQVEMRCKFHICWLEIFWKWVKDHNLQLFANMFVVPIVHKIPGLLCVRKLQLNSPIVCVQKNEFLPNVKSVVSKLGIQYTECKFLKHRKLMEYLKPLSPDGVLTAIEIGVSSVQSIRKVTFSMEEATAFQEFLSSQRQHSDLLQHQQVLENLSIFVTVDCLSPVSLVNGSGLLAKTVVVEPLDSYILNCALFSSSLTVLSKNKNQRSLLQACRQVVKFPQSVASVLKEYIFPQIRNGVITAADLVPMMQGVLDNLSRLPAVAQDLAHLCFIPDSSNKLVSPSVLSDPSNSELKYLFRGESVFPLKPFDKESYLRPLRECGLKVSVTSQDLYDVLCKIAGRKSLEFVGEIKASRALAVFKYIREHTEVLNEEVEINWCSTQVLRDAICSLAKEKSILPIECVAPVGDYPECLPWKGSGCSHYLTKMNDTVQLCTHRNAVQFSNLVGSQMYLVHCPSELCSAFGLMHPFSKVLGHLAEIIRRKNGFTTDNLGSVTARFYSYLNSHLSSLIKAPLKHSAIELHRSEWIWNVQEEKFVQPRDVAFKQHPKFHHSLSPYVCILPQKFRDLFIRFGAHEEVTDELLVSVLERVKDRCLPEPKSWNIVSDILNWLTDEGTASVSKKVRDLNTVYVPVRSSSHLLKLVRVDDVTYVDGKHMQRYASKDRDLKIIHGKYEHLAKYLGATPLSKRLNISADLCSDAGQSESLVQRLQNILRDYEGGLTIVKELIQNADDAGASEVNICYDTRKHVVSEDDLMFPGMSRAHGPALLFHNNKTFSDKDFKDIQDLAGATKRNQPLKIGKFGLGFCSVYHLTDVPSFVSRDWLYIFDPRLEYLQLEVIDPRQSGKKLHFTMGSPPTLAQMTPYVGLFGFKADRPYDGTIFRFPFRSQKHGISDVKFDDKEVTKLYEEVEKAGPNLLLFLENVNCITFSRINDGQTSPQSLLQVKKDPVCRATSRTWQQGMCQLREQVCLTAGEVEVSVTKFQDGTISKQHWLIAGSKDILTHRVGAVACLLKEQPCGVYTPKQVIGRAFCFLPLHDNLKTGLPVHVNANFAVMNDRKGIHRSDSTSGSEQSKFNVTLMKTSIPQAYHKLLSVLQELSVEGRVAVDEYVFHSLWPVHRSLQTHNPWDHFIPELYRLVSGSKLCYSETVGEWRCLTDCKLLPLDILQLDQRDNVKEAMATLQYPLIELPREYREHLEKEVRSSTICESQFLVDFFANIDLFHTETRNGVLLSLITTYAMESESAQPYHSENSFPALYPPAHHRRTTLRQFIDNHCCIPCSPEGEELKKCCDIIDHRHSSKFALDLLYDPWEGRFVVDSFKVVTVMGALQELGMVSNKLPWGMIIERAKTVSEMYRVDRDKALKRTELLLHCIEEIETPILPSEAEELYKTPFLPVLQKPHDYPLELDWKGSGQGLLSSSQVLVGSSNIQLLAGSIAWIVSSDGGCGRISDRLASSLNISLSPTINDVMHQLNNIANLTCSHSEDFTSWVNGACKEIYYFIEKYLGSSVDGSPTVKDSFCRSDLLWTGAEFIHRNSIALDWHYDGPYLYRLPPLLQSGSYNILKLLDLKKRFETDQLLEALVSLKDGYGGNSLPRSEREMVLSVVKALAESIDDDCPTPDAECIPCYIPDENFCMREAWELAWNNAPWCKSDQEVSFVCNEIPRGIALKLGVKPSLDRYSTSTDLFNGVPFGQHEHLIQRIRDILSAYVYNEAVLKELLQNADDAKATKLYIILDERMHGTEKLPSDAWKDLQGPALLVWNDQGFTEDNLAGIQSLGLGSKRSKSESIGQFGIGFNVVYHLTDCPSFFTNGNTLCTLDPHCRYVPGANERHPGRRWNNLDEKFWDNWCDLKSAYLREGLKCPDEMSASGTLFRFPLRSTDNLVEGQMLVDKEDYVPRTSSMMEEDLNKWAPKMKEALLFLKHVTDLRFFVIKEGASEMTITHHFMADISRDGIEGLRGFQNQCSDFSPGCTEASVASYSLKLIEKAPVEQNEEWFVQQGIGDINNHSQHWEFLSRIKPMHGIAVKIKGSDYDPMIFCFLPLAQMSRLPVHVNGNFVLDSPSRSDLWKSRNPQCLDSKAQWNNNLVEAIGSSYADFLVKCQDCVVDESYTEANNLARDLERYYGLFPKWTNVSVPPESSMLHLAKRTYKILGEKKSEVLVTVVKTGRSSSSRSSKFDVNWQPVLNGESSRQVYFWPQASDNSTTAEPDVTKASNTENESDGGLTETLQTSAKRFIPAGDPPAVCMEETSSNVDHEVDQYKRNVPPILKRLGILLTAAPEWIRGHFVSVDVLIPEATPMPVFKYFSEHFSQSVPCKIKDSVFRDVESFKIFVKFVTVEVLVTEKGTTDDILMQKKFISKPFGFPLLLTADEVLRELSEEDRVISSKYWEIFPSKRNKFLHPHLLELKLDPSYFLEASHENWDIVCDILESSLDNSLICQRLKYASAFININDVLKPLWICMSEDPVIKKHLKEIVQKWALILSKKCELFRYDPKHTYLMPVATPWKPKHLAKPDGSPPSPEEKAEEEEEYNFLSRLFEIFKANRMPCVDGLVRRVKDICPTFSKPESILANLYHLYIQHGCFDALCLKNRIYDNVPALFSYFSRIDFVRDKESLSRIKKMPLFKSIDGEYRSLLGEVYSWPEHICMEGIGKLLRENSAVFVDDESHWHKLTLSNPSTLGLHEIDAMNLYVKYLFPHFHLLNEEERFRQLKHIRDTSELFQTAAKFIQDDSNTPPTLKSTETEFIQGLKDLPMLLKDGELACVCEFCDPFNAVFRFFPGSYGTIPDKFITGDPEWLSFFKKIGLQKQPTLEEFEQFCRELPNGNHSDIRKASGALVKCLFEVHEWHKNAEFLHRIRSIPFVCLEALEEYNWIFPAMIAGAQVICQQDGTRVLVTCLENCATSNHASLVWTVCPVVDIPDVKFPPINTFLFRDARKMYETAFKENLGLLEKPAASHVINNILNLSRSQFSDFKLFESYSQECVNKSKRQKRNLVDIVADSFTYLDRALTEMSKKKGHRYPLQVEITLSDISPLQNAPCIPVSSDCTDDMSKPVLVKPFQVVRNLNEEFKASLHPFLCSLPKAIGNSNVLDHIGVNSQPQLSNILHALKLIESHVEMPIDHNAAKTVKSLLKMLYELLSSSKLDGTVTLYLPSRNRRLFRSADLIYNDLDPMSYGGENFDLASIPENHSVASLLCDEYSEIEGYGFRLSDLLSKLPKYLHPMLLSECCSETLHSSCHIQETLSPLACEFKQALQLKEFVEVVEHVLRTKNPSEKQAYTRFASSLKILVKSVEVLTVTNLTVDILYKEKFSIGTANVDFLLQKSGEGEYTLFVHEHPLLFRIYERIVKRITKEVLTRSGVSRTALAVDHVEEVMGVILSGGTVDNIKKVLVIMDVNPTQVKLERDFDYSAACPVIGGEIPVELHHRLRSDINNRFKPQEWVGYEKENSCFVYALVEYRVVSNDEDDDGEWDEYIIRIGDTMQVSVIDLYKILCIRESQEFELYDPTPGAVELCDSIRDKSIEDIEGMISQELQQILKLRDQNGKKKALKAMYLRWHPGGNDHPLATKAFQFLQEQLEGVYASDMYTVEQMDDTIHRRTSSMAKEKIHHSLCKSDPLNCQVTVSKRLADVWITQAKHDVRAMEVMYEACKRPDEKLCAHVCFLAHQVAEKTLKAGMYATVGLGDFALHKHFLYPLAKALRQVIPDSAAAVLPELAEYFEQKDCYLSTRYPNRCGGVPSECFNLKDADKASEKSKELFKIVYNHIIEYI